jgi:hypothetical protein
LTSYFLDEKPEDGGKVGEWIMSHFDRKPTAPYRAIGMLDEAGKLIGGAMFNGFNGSNVDVTLVVPYISRKLIVTVFTYTFIYLRCQRVTARVRRGGPKERPPLAFPPKKGKLPILQRLGFHFEGTAKRWYGPGVENDALVFCMLRDECFWLKESDNGLTRSARSRRDGQGPSADEQRNGHRSTGPQQHQPGHALGQSHL